MPNEIDEPEVIETPAPAPEVEEDDDLEPEVPGEAPPNETPEQKDARIAALEERNEKLWARLQRQKSKPAPAAAPAAPAAPAPAAPAAAPTLSREETRLIAQGFSDEAIEQAKKVAAIQNVGLIEATNDPIFKAWKEMKDKEVKSAAAQLPASKGGRAPIKKTFGSKGLSDDDHKELFKEKVGQ